MFKGIDLFSDTLTQPTEAMKKAMMSALLGDEQKGEDPTTRKLEETTAELLGQEAALFFPSSTMANQVAISLLCQKGDELIAAENCHILNAEGGGPAVHSGVMTKPIVTPTGIFNSDQLKNAVRAIKGPHYPISKLACIENTTNMGGGFAWDLETLNSVLLTAKELNLKTHLDGSRLFNAVVKISTPAHKITSGFDTVTICFSKGLGCPMGAVLGFKKNDFEKVRRLKQLFGGSMRQSGILAAAALYALENNINRLAEDHINAQKFAERLNTEIPEIQVENNPPCTNMVFFRWSGNNLSSLEFHENCIKKGLRFSRVAENRFRAVTHLNISSQDIDTAINILKEIK
jgi:threonine aldolase